MKISQIVKLFVFLIISFSLSICIAELKRGSPKQFGFSENRLKKISSFLKKEIKNGQIPGAVFLIAKNGKIIFSESLGFQDKKKEISMNKKSIFRAYSMTKPMISVLTMMLVEDGVLELTDPIGKFFPSLIGLKVLSKSDNAESSKINADNPIKIYDLLRHTSGITYPEFSKSNSIKKMYSNAGLFSNKLEAKWIFLSPEEQVEAFSKLFLIHQPGSSWEYGLSTDLLGRILEKVTKKNLSALLNEKLIKPLKMVDTAFVVPKDKKWRIAEPFEQDPLTLKPFNLLLDFSKPMGNYSGGAGIVTTADDYLRFCQMLLDGGIFNGKRLLSRTTIKLMTSDHLGSSVKKNLEPGELLLGVKGYTFGLGFMIRKSEGASAIAGSKGEYSWGGYAGTFFWIDPKENLIGILMSQTPGAIRTYYRRMFKTLVYQAIE
tara:strand:- start:743 stop:2038 length:1296 start_codon:yes stop_codon:yes gene_type:complete